jgi:hypothetical protein
MAQILKPGCYCKLELSRGGANTTTGADVLPSSVTAREDGALAIGVDAVGSAGTTVIWMPESRGIFFLQNGEIHRTTPQWKDATKETLQK